MVTTRKSICKATEKVCNNHLMHFAKSLRKRLHASGVDNELVDECIKVTVQEMRNDSSYNSECLNTLEWVNREIIHKENRGLDLIGRIIVEYCFIRFPERKMVWPDNSPQDQSSRKAFTNGVIPRPLLRYFLVTIRGSIPELNSFEMDSVLFGKENEVYVIQKRNVESIIDEFLADSVNSASIQWDKIYDDLRFQKITLDLVGDIRRKIEQFGLERYLRMLENIRQRDPEKTLRNKMERAFNLEDIKMLDEALWTAEELLSSKFSA